MGIIPKNLEYKIMTQIYQIPSTEQELYLLLTIIN